MECVESAALKTNIIQKEMNSKFSPLAFFDDFCLQNVTSCDDFIVDELLDFSNEEAGGFIGEAEEKPSTPYVSAQLQENTHFSDCSSDFSAAELGVPADDLANLEWLSHFVEDSNSEYSTPFPAGVSSVVKPKEEDNGFITSQNTSFVEPCFKIPVPAKARSKRTRTGVRVWPLGSPSLTAEPSPSSSSSSSTSYSAPSSPYLFCSNPGTTHDPNELVSFEKLPKQKKRLAGDGGYQTPRRCSHCGVQKTPQWRTGPLGAKTLCNACGVRFKSGRLLPEYRPACSPTFSNELHSNHHRKVLEMRKKKEPSVLGQADPSLAAPAVPSFG